MLEPKVVPTRSARSSSRLFTGGVGTRVSTTLRVGNVSRVKAILCLRSTVTVKRPAITSPRPATSAGTSSSQPETATGTSRSPWSVAKPSRISRSKPGRPCSWKNSSACFIWTASTRSVPRALIAARSDPAADCASVTSYATTAKVESRRMC